MYKYKGSVATVSALPDSGNTTGDVYNVESSDIVTALAVGIVSGFAATGINQIYKQAKNA